MRLNDVQDSWEVFLVRHNLYRLLLFLHDLPPPFAHAAAPSAFLSTSCQTKWQANKYECFKHRLSHMQTPVAYEISQYRSVWTIAHIAPGTHPMHVKTRQMTNWIAAAPLASDSEANGFVRSMPLYATYAAIIGGMRQANKSMKILRMSTSY